MRLLLTSAGVTNSAIASELERLLGRQKNRNVAFIPTAAHPEPGDKDWFLRQVTDLQKFGYGLDYLDWVDPSAPGLDWRPRLEKAGIVMVGGGHTGYLRDRMRDSDCDNWLHDRLTANKIVCICISAASLLVSPSIAAAAELYGEEPYNGAPLNAAGLCWVDFELLPHVGTEVDTQDAKVYAAERPHEVHLLTDEDAISVHGKKTQMIKG